MSEKCPATNKTIFPKKKDAHTFITGNTNLQDIYLREYHCEHCNGWHITHMDLREFNPKPKRRKIKHKDDFRRYLAQ